MGRKIPGKRHRGIKNPEKQRENREHLLKHKINCAPNDDDQQELPRKMKYLFDTKSGIQNEKCSKRIKKKKHSSLLDSSKYIDGCTEMMKGNSKSRPLKPIPIFRQNVGESEGKFFRRMDKGVWSVIKEKQYEDKYGVDVIRDVETGRTTLHDRIGPDAKGFSYMSDRTKAKLAKKGIFVKTKEEKRVCRRLKEKEKRLKHRCRRKGVQKQEDCFVQKFEESLFGVVNNAPPTLIEPNFRHKLKSLPSNLQI